MTELLKKITAFFWQIPLFTANFRKWPFSYSVTKNLTINLVDLASIKACFQDTQFTSYSTFDKNISPLFNLSKDEFKLLRKLKNENKLIIQKEDKVDIFHSW